MFINYTSFHVSLSAYALSVSEFQFNTYYKSVIVERRNINLILSRGRYKCAVSLLVALLCDQQHGSFLSDCL